MAISHDTSKNEQDGSVFLAFTGLNGIAELRDCSELLDPIAAVMHLWPFAIGQSASEADIFVTISKTSEGLYRIQRENGDTKDWDAINTVCDLVSEIAWERLRTQPELLCVHGAAVQFGRRLVLFPNAKRAGKSTLTCALAHLGRTVFTDDFVSIVVGPTGSIRGISNGILPRIRLPVPTRLSDEFRKWISDSDGPQNSQYKYVASAAVAPQSKELPIGAIVVLDRKSDPIPPALDPIDRATAIRTMITQNFSREVMSGHILRSIGTLTKDLPLFRLTYNRADEAAEFLAQCQHLTDLPAATLSNSPGAPGLAPKAISPMPMQFSNSAAYCRISGLVEVRTDQDLFLADTTGTAIHHLNQGSIGIWNLLQEPNSLAEVCQILCAAFPDTDAHQIEADTQKAMAQMAIAGLIEVDQELPAMAQSTA